MKKVGVEIQAQSMSTLQNDLNILKKNFNSLKQHVKDQDVEIGFCKVGMRDILKRLSTLEMENKGLKRQIKEPSKNEEGLNNEETVNNEGKLNDDEAVNTRTVGEPSNSGLKEEDEEFLHLYKKGFLFLFFLQNLLWKLRWEMQFLSFFSALQNHL